jgi:hypothetical protein
VLDQAIAAALRPDYPRSRPETEEPAGPIPALVREPSPVAHGEPESDSGARLPPESIQRVVRASSGRFRRCYQRALTRDPNTDGHVVTLFVIGADGLVQLAQEERTTLSDRLVRECVQRAFFELQFPKPPGGQPITVIYPMRFGHGATPPLDLPSASKSAEPPPPGFAERMRSGIPVPPDPVVMPFEDAAPAPSSSCTPGDPMCAEL